MSEFLTIGEPLAVFEACDLNQPLSDVAKFNKYLAGAELNVAIGVQRLQHRTIYISAVGNDPLGIFIRQVIEKAGVSTNYLFDDADHWTGFYLKQRVSHGSPGIYYYRKNSAAANLSFKTINQIDLSGVRIAHLTGIYPALSTNSLDTFWQLNHRLLKQDTLITFDPNLREALWPSRRKMIETINTLAKLSQIILPGIHEGKILTGSANPEKIAKYYLDQSTITRIVIVKLGPKGAYVKERNHLGYIVQGFKVDKVVDTVGAGDGFAVGLISALLEDQPLNDAVKRACAIGAMAVQSYGDSDGYPTKTKLKAFLANNK